MRKPDIRWALTVTAQTIALVWALMGNIYAERLFIAWVWFGVLVSSLAFVAVALNDKPVLSKDNLRSDWATKADKAMDVATTAALIACGWFVTAAAYAASAMLTHNIVQHQKEKLKGGDTK